MESSNKYQKTFMLTLPPFPISPCLPIPYRTPFGFHFFMCPFVASASSTPPFIIISISPNQVETHPGGNLWKEKNLILFYILFSFHRLKCK